MRFPLPLIKCLATPSSVPTTAVHCFVVWFDYHVLDSGRKLGGAAEHLIDGSEKSAFVD